MSSSMSTGINNTTTTAADKRALLEAKRAAAAAAKQAAVAASPSSEVLAGPSGSAGPVHPVPLAPMGGEDGEYSTSPVPGTQKSGKVTEEQLHALWEAVNDIARNGLAPGEDVDDAEALAALRGTIEAGFAQVSGFVGDVTKSLPAREFAAGLPGLYDGFGRMDGPEGEKRKLSNELCIELANLYWAAVHSVTREFRRLDAGSLSEATIRVAIRDYILFYKSLDDSVRDYLVHAMVEVVTGAAVKGKPATTGMKTVLELYLAGERDAIDHVHPVLFNPAPMTARNAFDNPRVGILECCPLQVMLRWLAFGNRNPAVDAPVKITFDAFCATVREGSGVNWRNPVEMRRVLADAGQLADLIAPNKGQGASESAKISAKLVTKLSAGSLAQALSPLVSAFTGRISRVDPFPAATFLSMVFDRAGATSEGLPADFALRVHEQLVQFSRGRFAYEELLEKRLGKEAAKIPRDTARDGMVDAVRSCPRAVSEEVAAVEGALLDFCRDAVVGERGVFPADVARFAEMKSVVEEARARVDVPRPESESILQLAFGELPDLTLTVEEEGVYRIARRLRDARSQLKRAETRHTAATTAAKETGARKQTAERLQDAATMERLKAKVVRLEEEISRNREVLTQVYGKLCASGCLELDPEDLADAGKEYEAIIVERGVKRVERRKLPNGILDVPVPDEACTLAAHWRLIGGLRPVQSAYMRLRPDVSRLLDDANDGVFATIEEMAAALRQSTLPLLPCAVDGETMIQYRSRRAAVWCVGGGRPCYDCTATLLTRPERIAARNYYLRSVMRRHAAPASFGGRFQSMLAGKRLYWDDETKQHYLLPKPIVPGEGASAAQHAAYPKARDAWVKSSVSDILEETAKGILVSLAKRGAGGYQSFTLTHGTERHGLPVNWLRGAELAVRQIAAARSGGVERWTGPKGGPSWAPKFSDLFNEAQPAYVEHPTKAAIKTRNDWKHRLEAAKAIYVRDVSAMCDRSEEQFDMLRGLLAACFDWQDEAVAVDRVYGGELTKERALVALLEVLRAHIDPKMGEDVMATLKCPPSQHIRKVERVEELLLRCQDFFWLSESQSSVTNVVAGIDHILSSETPSSDDMDRALKLVDADELTDEIYQNYIATVGGWKDELVDLCDQLVGTYPEIAVMPVGGSVGARNMLEQLGLPRCTVSEESVNAVLSDAAREFGSDYFEIDRILARIETLLRIHSPPVGYELNGAERVEKSNMAETVMKFAEKMGYQFQNIVRHATDVEAVYARKAEAVAFHIHTITSWKTTLETYRYEAREYASVTKKHEIAGWEATIAALLHTLFEKRYGHEVGNPREFVYCSSTRWMDRDAEDTPEGRKLAESKEKHAKAYAELKIAEGGLALAEREHAEAESELCAAAASLDASNVELCAAYDEFKRNAREYNHLITEYKVSDLFDNGAVVREVEDLLKVDAGSAVATLAVASVRVEENAKKAAEKAVAKAAEKAVKEAEHKAKQEAARKEREVERAAVKAGRAAAGAAAKPVSEPVAEVSPMDALRATLNRIEQRMLPGLAGFDAAAKVAVKAAADVFNAKPSAKKGKKSQSPEVTLDHVEQLVEAASAAVEAAVAAKRASDAAASAEGYSAGAGGRRRR